MVVQMIKELTDKILVVLKESSFSREDLIVINNYFRRIVEVTNQMLKKGGK